MDRRVDATRPIKAQSASYNLLKTKVPVFHFTVVKHHRRTEFEFLIQFAHFIMLL